VLRQVRAHERTRLLPTVVLTTSVEQRDVIEGYRLGANAYVQKPVALEDFVVAAGRLGLFWLLVNVRPPQVGG
jgi:two-component system response regulator